MPKFGTKKASIFIGIFQLCNAQKYIEKAKNAKQILKKMFLKNPQNVENCTNIVENSKIPQNAENSTKT
jgi:hypothetical protein